MQTPLPYLDFIQSAKVLDFHRRKQGIEARRHLRDIHEILLEEPLAAITYKLEMFLNGSSGIIENALSTY